MVKLSPQPHSSVTLGLENGKWNPALRTEIDDGTIQKGQAVVRHDQFDAVLLKNNVIGLDLVGQINGIGPAGATGFLDAQPQADAAVALDKTAYPLCRNCVN